jgi:AcrR family transcriptional regulator
MTENRKPDRRVARTVRLLREALMQLVVEKGYDAITIQDITDRADVSRTTFYLHFRDKDDLLITSMEMLYDTLTEPYLGRPPAPPAQEAALMRADTTDFRHIAEFATFYRAIMSSKGSATFVYHLRKYLAERVELNLLTRLLPPGTQPRLPLPFIAYFIAGGQLGVTQWWFDNDMKVSPEEMSVMMFDIASFGAMWAAGLGEERIL